MASMKRATMTENEFHDIVIDGIIGAYRSCSEPKPNDFTNIKQAPLIKRIVADAERIETLERTISELRAMTRSGEEDDGLGQVVPSSALPPLCRECNAPGTLYERPAERRWVHASPAAGRHHDFAHRAIHWSGAPEGVCERKDKKLDAYYPVTQPNAGGTVGFSALADHPGNVTCPTCKAEADKGCNRHRDCKAADEAWKAKTGGTFVPANFHCRDEDCDDCFGS